MRWFLVIFVPACWTGAPPSPSPPTPETPPPPRPVSFAAIAGEWHGIGYQPNTATSWEIEMTIEATAKVGDVVGTISYPTQGCRGELVRVRSKRGELRAKEFLPTNPAERCVDGGFIVLPLEPQGDRLPWVWLFPDGSPGASATLERTGI